MPRPRTKRRLTLFILFLIGIPLVTFGLIGELAVRALLTRRTLYDVEMSRYALQLKVKSPNPLIGHLHRPSSGARLMGVDVQINSDGLRDAEYPVAKGRNRRLIFLGDSLTLGWGVPAEDTFENRIEESLSARAPTEILNFGVGNYNTSQAVNLLISKGLKYRPDGVALFYFVNDAEPTPQRSRWAWLAHSRLLTFLRSRTKQLMARLQPSGETFSGFYSGLYEPDRPGWTLARQALAELKSLSEQHSFDLKVVLLPELHNLVRYPFEKEYALVAAELEKNGIAYLDLTPFFGNEMDPKRLWVSRDDAHPNSEGHRLIAEYSLEFLSDLGSEHR